MARARSRKSQPPEVLCERILMDGTTPVRAWVGVPEPWGRDWRCAFCVDVKGATVAYTAGVDAMQALLGAFQGLRARLHAHPRPLTWLGMEDHGFPFMVSNALGTALIDRVEAFYQAEVARLFPDDHR